VSLKVKDKKPIKIETIKTTGIKAQLIKEDSILDIVVIDNTIDKEENQITEAEVEKITEEEGVDTTETLIKIMMSKTPTVIENTKLIKNLMKVHSKTLTSKKSQEFTKIEAISVIIEEADITEIMITEGFNLKSFKKLSKNKLLLKSKSLLKN
jgi:hypothetical protein